MHRTLYNINDEIKISVENAVNNMHIAKSGPKLYLNEIEKDILASYCDFKDQSGYGLNRRGICVSDFYFIILLYSF